MEQCYKEISASPKKDDQMVVMMMTKENSPKVQQFPPHHLFNKEVDSRKSISNKENEKLVKDLFGAGAAIPIQPISAPAEPVFIKPPPSVKALNSARNSDRKIVKMTPRSGRSGRSRSSSRLSILDTY